MKLSINASLSGQELLDLFISQLKANNIDPALDKIKFLVTKKDNSEVEIDVDKIRLSYSNE